MPSKAKNFAHIALYVVIVIGLILVCSFIGGNPEDSPSQPGDTLAEEPLELGERTPALIYEQIILRAKNDVLNAQKPLLALSFDDGPYEPVTTRLLDTLKKYNAHATFFVIGNRVKNNSALIVRAHEEGHEIASQGYDHTSFKELSGSEIESSIAKTDELIEGLIGVKTTLLRAPYGTVTQTSKKVIDKPFVNWSVDSEDWSSRNAEAVIKEVTENAGEGDVVLMHDLYPSTADACETLIKELSEKYRLVTISEMFRLSGVTPENGVLYHGVKEYGKAK